MSQVVSEAPGINGERSVVVVGIDEGGGVFGADDADRAQNLDVGDRIAVGVSSACLQLS